MQKHRANRKELTMLGSSNPKISLIPLKNKTKISITKYQQIRLISYKIETINNYQIIKYSIKLIKNKN